MEGKNKCCCEEHVDMGFDDFLNENEVFPHMEVILDKKCSYCEAQAKYILKVCNENK